MWIVAGILLALVVLGFAAGLHVGPHAHVPAAVLGILAGGWLLAMALLGNAQPLLWLLFGADASLTAVMGVGALRVLRHPEAIADRDKPPPSTEGKLGEAVTELDPEGVVRVHGEQWSAISLNGKIDVGSPIQVIRANGVRLEVWGEENGLPAPPAELNEGTQT